MAAVSIGVKQLDEVWEEGKKRKKIILAPEVRATHHSLTTREAYTDHAHNSICYPKSIM
jgi:hypothetical protein